ncbi:MAG: hypothetical protein JNL50_05170 [Phycisphaerae bacterium]|nr:hypothetical protein [Phycisphaerae bacterium]
MARVVYSVCATLPNEALAGAYVSWLLGAGAGDGHVGQVMAGGATEGTVWREIGEGSIRVMSRYVFPGREAFDRYVREVAPGLRAEGLARFGALAGVSMERTVCEVVG